MKQLLFITTLFWASMSFGQTLDKGIYKGQKLSFTICYLTYTDSTVEVEFFFKKRGQIFDHIPTEKLEKGMESFATKPAFKSQDDSIKVYSKKDGFLIKRKGLHKVRVYKSKDSQSTITTLRNRYRLFVFRCKLFEKYNASPTYDQQKIYDKFYSYELDKYISLDDQKFIEKLFETEDYFKKNWP